MYKVLSILLIVLFVIVALFLIAAVGGLIVWAASGIGWTLINWLRLPFTPFEATLLSLIAMIRYSLDGLAVGGEHGLSAYRVEPARTRRGRGWEDGMSTTRMNMKKTKNRNK